MIPYVLHLLAPLSGVYNFDLVPGEVHVYDHCVKVIGWGRQRRANGGGAQEYLLLVNSWSSLWAKDGLSYRPDQMISDQRSLIFRNLQDGLG